MEDETTKKLLEERKREIRRKVLRGTVAIVIIAIIIGGYAFYESVQDKYYKAENMKIPNVNWSTVKSSYVLKREIPSTYYPPINKTIGNEKSDGKFKVCILTEIKSYTYRPGEADILSTVPEVFAEKVGGDYVVKELVFHYKFGDKYLSGFITNYLIGKNLYFVATTGNFDSYSDKMSYEWYKLHELRGVNKDGSNIKECGFTFWFEIHLYDSYPHWINHTITLTVTLYYGHPTFFGWLDVHKLSTSVVIYVMPEK